MLGPPLGATDVVLVSAMKTASTEVCATFGRLSRRRASVSFCLMYSRCADGRP